MPKIINFSRFDIERGNHQKPNENTILIRIFDVHTDYPKPYHTFTEVLEFTFLDLEYNSIGTDLEEFMITQEQANEICDVLKRAMENGSDVYVHCTAGICRSGAVVQAGVELGFDDPNIHRQPNIFVLHKLRESLGLINNDWTCFNHLLED